MLYKKNKGAELDMDLFREPTAEYRGTPFWAWNCVLDRDQVLRQIDYFKEMGFGGFHMHSRTGMGTAYLSEEFMGHIKACVEKAKEKDMLAWLYDEDRWASGAAGGLVTKHKELRRKRLIFTRSTPPAALPKEQAFAAGKPYYLASYDVELDNGGFLKSYRRIGREEPGTHDKWSAYVKTAADDPWFNNQSYPDTMDKEAIQKFIEVTYQAYEQAVGKDFDGVVPAIFTDEPNFGARDHVALDRANGQEDVNLPWSRYFEERYQEQYSEDLLDRLPELIWLTRDRRDTQVKYRFFDFCAEQFAQSFADQCGSWCEEHGLAFTGHVLQEVSLADQTGAVGDNMRQYRSFTIPGIDMLCNRVELTTAKQCQSVVHQMGKEAMLSELYGVTNWDFDFRGHKFQGDWQAALGVTVRVPHLSWMSMAGEAKRDYPASIFYQSAWYKEYPYLEDHYARLNTVLTRGAPVVRVGLIHPVESYWIQIGPNDQTGEIRQVLDQNFAAVTKWLLEGHYDFNYLNESLLPGLADKNAPRNVGKMEYDVIVVPECLTLRRTTVDYLTDFKKAGGQVVFMGDRPAYVNGVAGDGAKALFESAEHISFNQSALTRALEPFRTVDIRRADGMPENQMLYQLRQDGDALWLFAAWFQKDGRRNRASQEAQTDLPVGRKIEITVKGTYQPMLYDTLNGKVLPIGFRHQGGNTVVYSHVFSSDSLLIRFTEPHYNSFTPQPETPEVLGRLDYKQTVPYRLEEPNVLLLDQAEYKLDEGDWRPREEILRLDNALRKELGFPGRMEKFAQPWVVPEEPAVHTAALRFTIHSRVRVKAPVLALEDAELATLSLDGRSVPNTVTGWYVDEAIKTVALPELKKGDHILTVQLPFSRRSNLESCYLLGDFGVEVQGTETVLTALPEQLGFGGLCRQGLPFYGGNITYELPVEVPADCDMEVYLGRYKGALCRVALDDRESVPVAFAPYNVAFRKVEKGKHLLKITVFGHRFNTFGCVHNCADNYDWYGPNSWRTKGDDWSYEYQVKDMGLLTSPRIRLYR